MSRPAHGPKPIGLRRGSRRGWAVTLTRLCAVALILLVLLHLLFLYLVADQSPPWRHGMDAVDNLLLAGSGIEGTGLAGWLFVILALACAAALWSLASRAAALLFLGAALWDAWWRIWELSALSDGDPIEPFPVYVGAFVAFFALFFAILAMIGALFADRSGGGLEHRRLG